VIVVISTIPLIGVFLYHGAGTGSKLAFGKAVVLGLLIILCASVAAVIVWVGKASDQCPKCEKVTYYYKADRGMFLTCENCEAAWRAGSAPA
jgi:multisubunit Na+/H+ antiporter MnhG subunit